MKKITQCSSACACRSTSLIFKDYMQSAPSVFALRKDLVEPKPFSINHHRQASSSLEYNGSCTIANIEASPPPGYIAKCTNALSNTVRKFNAVMLLT